MYARKRSGDSIVLLAGALILAAAGGCGRNAATQSPSAVDVRVAMVEKRDVPVVREWIGTLDGFVNAQIRAQVSGYLVRQDYKEGSPVRPGDPMFEIDPRPFKAALAQAEGQLAQARAQLGKAELDVKRFTPLALDKAISQEELDDAVQARFAASAQVASAQASVDQARLNLGFTHIVSPIAGIAGLVQGQIGDLVGPSTGVLTTVSTVDPIKAYFPISEQDYLGFRGRSPDAPGIPAGIGFDLVLTDGSIYPRKGKLFAIDRQVDVNTGTLRIAAVFPNPSGLLRPGQYGRVRANVGTVKDALLVPLRALNDLQGASQLAVVDPENRVHLATVTTGEQIGSMVVVRTGIHAGDRVVVEGIQKVRDGAVVNPVGVTTAEVAR